MDFKKPLHWHQGLFLEPQHFQYLQNHVTESFAHTTRSLSKYDASILELSFNKDVITAGIVEITRLSCQFADGTLISLPGNITINTVSLDGETPAADGLYDIYITLVPLTQHGNNIPANSSDQERYRFVENNVITLSDMFEHDEQASVRTLRYDVRMHAGEQTQTSSLLHLKIARIQKTTDGYNLCEHFIPSIQFVSDSEVLTELVKQFSANLVLRYEQLESFTSLAGNRYVDINGASLSNLLAMQTLSRFIPVFSHIASVEKYYVEDLYIQCRQLISNLSMFSKSVSVEGNIGEQDILDFNSTRLGDVFTQLKYIIHSLLTELTIDPEKLLIMQKQQDGQFTAALPQDFLQANTSLYLRFKTTANVESHLDDITRFAKFGADGQVSVYAKRALPGVKLTYLVRKPLGVSSTPNSYYFVVDRFGFEWQKVAELGRLGLVWSSAPDDLEIDIIAVKG